MLGDEVFFVFIVFISMVGKDKYIIKEVNKEIYKYIMGYNINGVKEILWSKENIKV